MSDLKGWKVEENKFKNTEYVPWMPAWVLPPPQNTHRNTHTHKHTHKHTHTHKHIHNWRVSYNQETGAYICRTRRGPTIQLVFPPRITSATSATSAHNFRKIQTLSRSSLKDLYFNDFIIPINILYNVGKRRPSAIMWGRWQWYTQRQRQRERQRRLEKSIHFWL